MARSTATRSSRTPSRSATADTPDRSNAADDRLRTYRSKRDFTATPEPPAEAASGSLRVPGPVTGRFVVQRHRASSLHYDFRLEVDGVLASWAVPRGPTLDPAQRRLAVRVEDHPLGYFDFEGVIPAHEYGGGDVIVWDWGTYRADPDTPDPAKAIEGGQFKFELDGEKLEGAFVLVRTAGFGRQRARPRPDGTRAKWLLIHRRDGAAIPDWDAEDTRRSVKTGRTNEEVAAGRRPPSARRLQRPSPDPRASQRL
ncbi:MAG: DNA polymerase ligase N-terminal domain-containing protein [Chloroflexota bacterium]